MSDVVLDPGPGDACPEPGEQGPVSDVQYPSPTVDSITSLIASAAFVESQRAAARLTGDAAGLRELLTQVEAKIFRVGSLHEEPSGVLVDIASAVVDAHLEELDEPDLSPDRLQELTDDVRCQLVVAALHYVVTEQDVVPDSLPDGHRDDLAVLRYATGAARGEVTDG